MDEKGTHNWIVELKIIWLEIKWGVAHFWKYYIASIPTRIHHRWNTLWVREDEFHRSLDFDIDYFEVVKGKSKDDYIKDLIRRREIAHQRDLDRS